MANVDEKGRNYSLLTQGATADMYEGVTSAIDYYQSRGIPPDSKTLVEAQREIKQEIPAYVNDIRFYRWAIYSIGAVLILGICFITLLAYLDKEIPTVLGNIASIAIGVLAGLFAPHALKR